MVLWSISFISIKMSGGRQAASSSALFFARSSGPWVWIFGWQKLLQIIFVCLPACACLLQFVFWRSLAGCVGQSCKPKKPSARGKWFNWMYGIQLLMGTRKHTQKGTIWTYTLDVRNIDDLSRSLFFVCGCIIDINLYKYY